MNSKRKTLKTFVRISSKNSASGRELRLFLDLNRFALVQIQSTYLLNRGQYCTPQYTKILEVSEIYVDVVYTVVRFFSPNVFSFSLAFLFSRFILVSLFLLPLYPYLLIPLFPFTRKRWAGIGKKIDWSSYREITTCPSILSPSFYLSLSLSHPLLQDTR